jgi:hypothetical protein
MGLRLSSSLVPACELLRGADIEGLFGLYRLEELMFLILIVLLVLALAGGGWGHSRYGYAGWSPAGLIVLVFVIFWLTGSLHL